MKAEAGRPDVELATVEGFTVKRGAPEVTDTQVEEQIEQLRDQRAAWSPVLERPLPGDMVTVSKKPQKLRLIHPIDHNYYEVCRTKLGWGSRLGSSE